MNNADGVVGVKHHTILKVRYRQIVLVAKSVDLPEERVTSAFARVQTDRSCWPCPVHVV